MFRTLLILSAIFINNVLVNTFGRPEGRGSPVPISNTDWTWAWFTWELNASPYRCVLQYVGNPVSCPPFYFEWEHSSPLFFLLIFQMTSRFSMLHYNFLELDLALPIYVGVFKSNYCCKVSKIYFSSNAQDVRFIVLTCRLCSDNFIWFNSKRFQ